VPNESSHLKFKDGGSDNVLRGHSYRTPQKAVIDEYELMVK
jgi:hypothetical protein